MTHWRSQVVDANTGKLECCGKVNYYMSGDTLYMNKPFGSVIIIFTYNKTHKMCINGDGNLFAVKKKKSGLWYAVIKKDIDTPKGCYVSIINPHCRGCDATLVKAS